MTPPATPRIAVGTVFALVCMIAGIGCSNSPDDQTAQNDSQNNRPSLAPTPQNNNLPRSAFDAQELR